MLGCACVDIDIVATMYFDFNKISVKLYLFYNRKLILKKFDIRPNLKILLQKLYT